MAGARSHRQGEGGSGGGLAVCDSPAMQRESVLRAGLHLGLGAICGHVRCRCKLAGGERRRSRLQKCSL
eukprot:scaffold11814_cov52-Phaeocystis_antarctica.AAC.1